MNSKTGGSSWKMVNKLFRLFLDVSSWFANSNSNLASEMVTQRPATGQRDAEVSPPFGTEDLHTHVLTWAGCRCTGASEKLKIM